MQLIGSKSGSKYCQTSRALSFKLFYACRRRANVAGGKKTFGVLIVGKYLSAAVVALQSIKRFATRASYNYVQMARGKSFYSHLVLPAAARLRRFVASSMAREPCILARCILYYNIGIEETSFASRCEISATLHSVSVYILA